MTASLAFLENNNIRSSCTQPFSLNVFSLSILYQRGIYPAGSFRREQFYDLTLFVCDNKELQEYLSKVLQQLKGKIYKLDIGSSFLNYRSLYAVLDVSESTV